MSEPKVKILFYLPRELREQLRRWAFDRRVSQTSVIEQALEAYLKPKLKAKKG
jgi:hypothetical protein